jgi:hypothetical protein
VIVREVWENEKSLQGRGALVIQNGNCELYQLRNVLMMKGQFRNWSLKKRNLFGGQDSDAHPLPSRPQQSVSGGGSYCKRVYFPTAT